MSFRVGDRVRARLLDTGGHHRLPRYVQGRVGTVVAYRGAFPLPDAVVHGGVTVWRGLYCVRFAAGELWSNEERPLNGDCPPEDHRPSGDHGSNGHGVHLDLFEDYLRHENGRHENGEASS